MIFASGKFQTLTKAYPNLCSLFLPRHGWTTFPSLRCYKVGEWVGGVKVGWHVSSNQWNVNGSDMSKNSYRLWFSLSSVLQWTGEDSEDLKEGRVTRWKESGPLHDCTVPVSRSHDVRKKQIIIILCHWDFCVVVITASFIYWSTVFFKIILFSHAVRRM